MSSSRSLYPNRQYSRVLPLYKLILFTFLTLGLYQVYWCYHAWKSVGIAQNRGTQPGLRTLGMIVPGLNLIILYKLYKNINAICQKEGLDKPLNALLGILLNFFIGFFVFVIYQERFNEYWKTAEPDKNIRNAPTVGEIIAIVVCMGLLIFAILQGSKAQPELSGTSLSNRQSIPENAEEWVPVIEIEDGFSVRMPRFPTEEEEDFDGLITRIYTAEVSRLSAFIVMVIPMEGPVREDVKEELLQTFGEEIGSEYESMISLEATTLDGQPARLLITTEDDLYIYTLLSVKGNKVYRLSHATIKSEQPPEFDTFVESFKFIEIQDAKVD